MERCGGADQDQIPFRSREDAAEIGIGPTAGTAVQLLVQVLKTSFNPEAGEEGTTASLSGRKKKKMKHNLHYLVY